MNEKNLILGKIILLDLNLNKSYNPIRQFVMPLRPSVNQAYIIEGQQELEHSIHKIYCFKVKCYILSVLWFSYCCFTNIVLLGLRKVLRVIILRPIIAFDALFK